MYGRILVKDGSEYADMIVLHIRIDAKERALDRLDELRKTARAARLSPVSSLMAR